MLQKRTVVAIKFILSAFILVALFYWADISQIEQIWMNTSLIIVVAVIVILSLQVVIGAYRWLAVLQALKATISLSNAFINVYIGFFFNHALPSSVGGDFVRIYLAMKSQISMRTSITSIVIERIGTVLGLLLVIVTLSPFMEISENALIPREGIFLAALIGVIAVASVLLANIFRAKLPRGRFFDWIGHFCDDFSIVLKDKASFAKLMFWSVLGHLNVAIAVYISALALNVATNASLFEFLILVPPVFLITALPISVAGWGVREGAMITALSFIGIPVQDALIISITFGIADLIISLPGGLLWLFGKMGDMKQLNEMESS